MQKEWGVLKKDWSKENVFFKKQNNNDGRRKRKTKEAIKWSKDRIISNDEKTKKTLKK